ncbi:B2 protein-like [Nymphaea colorata]|nr:B2 protein-like [Nymphaea colorata]
MASQFSFWQLGDELRGQSKVSEDHKWLMVASKLAEQTKVKGERNNLDFTKTPLEPKVKDKTRTQDENKYETLNLDLLNLDSKVNESASKNSFRSGFYSMNAVYQKGYSNNNVNNSSSHTNNIIGKAKYSNDNIIKNCKDNNVGKENNVSNNNNVPNNITSTNTGPFDKRFKTLPSTEMLPRNQTLGGYIFVCNNDTMQEDLKRQLFGLPQRYRDSVRAITPGLPLFLYNYTTHQLHGIFEASSFGGTNIDPTAWEDKKCKGESRFPAQVRIQVRKLCKPLEEDSFRPVLHHYDGPKFRLELSVPETLALLDLCEQQSM